MDRISEAKRLAWLARRDILRMCSLAGASHVGSSLSVMDILAALYVTPGLRSDSGVDGPSEDRLILSKGHAASALYATLGQVGALTSEQLESYCQDGSLLGGHVTAGEIPLVDFSTGSLGHGLPVGVGMALAQQLQGHRARTFVVVSDGELNEGSTWEAAMFAAHHALSNLVVLIDRNGLQSLRTTEETLTLEPLGRKWEAFGWHLQVVDGHAHAELLDALEETKHAATPSVILAKTIKGYGVSFMENQVAWHYKSPSARELALALAELDRRFAHA